MPEKKSLVNIGYITDTETPVFSLGEVDGYFDHDILDNYIEYYGSEQLILHLARLQFQVIERQKSVNLDKTFEGIGSMCNVDVISCEE